MGTIHYTAAPSGRTREEITAQYNNSLYSAYGPDQKKKSGAVKLAADSLCEYERLLSVLREMGVDGVPLAEMYATPCPPDRIVCGIRHDLDMDFAASLQMGRLERLYGLRTSWYILHTAPYYGEFDGAGVFRRNEAMLEVYLQLQDEGHEVGLHIDPLHLYQNFKIDGAEALVTELDWLRSSGVRVVGTAAHNMATIYGAENYAVFKGRALSGRFVEGKPPSEIYFGEKWAPVGVLDEAELGLEYEANDLFHQGHSSVFYGAVRNLNSWRRVHEMSSPLSRTKDDVAAGFTDTATFFREMREVKPGRFIILAIHPVYYGARHSPESGPTQLSNGATWEVNPKLGWETCAAGSVLTRSRMFRTGEGGRDGKEEFQSIHCANRFGMLDMPFSSYDPKSPKRYLFLGGRNFDGAAVGLAAHVHLAFQEQLSAEKKGEKAQVWKFANPDLGISQLFSWFEKMEDLTRPSHVVLGIGADELVRSLPEFWKYVHGFRPDIAPGGFLKVAEDGTVEVAGGKEAGFLVSRALPVPRPAGLPDLGEEDLCDQAKALTAMVGFWEKRLGEAGSKLILMIENAGELEDPALVRDLERFDRRQAALESNLRKIIGSGEVTLVNPYPALLAENGEAFYHSSGEWNARGHRVAAQYLAESIAQGNGPGAVERIAAVDLVP